MEKLMSQIVPIIMFLLREKIKNKRKLKNNKIVHEVLITIKLIMKIFLIRNQLKIIKNSKYNSFKKQIKISKNYIDIYIIINLKKLNLIYC